MWGEIVFGLQNNIRLMKLMASATLSIAIKRQYSSVLPLLCLYLPVVTKFVELYIFFFGGVTLIKIANEPLDSSAVLVLSVIN